MLLVGDEVNFTCKALFACILYHLELATASRPYVPEDRTALRWCRTGVMSRKTPKQRGECSNGRTMSDEACLFPGGLMAEGGDGATGDGGNNMLE